MTEDPSEKPPLYQRIYAMVRQIPPGKVATYGQIARLVGGCTLRNLGNWGVLVHSGQEHGVVGCDLYELGDGGISITSGDRATLTPGGSYADNNHLHHLGRWDRCYVSTAITLAGVPQPSSRGAPMLSTVLAAERSYATGSDSGAR